MAAGGVDATQGRKVHYHAPGLIPFQRTIEFAATQVDDVGDWTEMYSFQDVAWLYALRVEILTDIDSNATTTIDADIGISDPGADGGVGDGVLDITLINSAGGLAEAGDVMDLDAAYDHKFTDVSGKRLTIKLIGDSATAAAGSLIFTGLFSSNSPVDDTLRSEFN